MGKPEIVIKLNSLLIEHVPFIEEYQIVYLLVEIRKILDRENNIKYPLLRFYCDWSVHTAKDKNTPEMRAIMEEIYIDISNKLTNPEALIPTGPTKIIEFVYMEDLQKELYSFLDEYRIHKSWVIDKDDWISFVSVLVNILTDQPINNPCPGIQQFCFLPAAVGSVGGAVYFTNKINNNESYNFGNVL